MKQFKVVRFATIFSVVAAVSFIRWWFTYNHSLTGIDDANIFFVYAKNLAEGNGLVYNVGGEAVEGFTSFLWVIILAFFYLTGHMEVVTLLFNLLLISYTLYRLSLFADSLNTFIQPLNKKVPGLISWIILAFICLIPGYIDWTILTLMETGLWSSLLVLSSLAVMELFINPTNKKRSMDLFYLIPLMIFTRPESLAWGLVFIAIRIVQLLYFRTKSAEVGKQSALLFCAYLIPLLLLIGFRLSYFGYLLPNTYYAKMSGTVEEKLIEGAYYLLRYVKENPFVPVFVSLFSVSLALIGIEVNKQKGKISPLALMQTSIIGIIGLQFLIPLYTGGDHFYLSRFMQPLYPIMLLGVFNGRFWKEHTNLRSFRVQKLQATFTVVIACLLVLLATQYSFLGPSPINKEFEIARMGRENGHQLNILFANQPKYPKVGTYLAGGIAYVYKGETIDMLGLNNTQMAHAPKKNNNGHKNHSSFNKDVFYQLSPDIIHIEFLNDLKEAKLNEKDSSDFQNQIYNFLFLDSTFREKYEPVVISTPVNGCWYQAYVHKTYLPHLSGEDQKVYILNREKNLQQVRKELLLQLSYK